MHEEVHIFNIPGPVEYPLGGFLVDVGVLKGILIDLVANTPDPDVIFQIVPLRVAGNSSLLKIMLFEQDGTEVDDLTDIRASDFVLSYTLGQKPITDPLPLLPPTPPPPPGLPGIPANFAGSGHFMQNRLTWDEPTGAPILNYKIYRGPNGGGGPLTLYDTISGSFNYYINLMDEGEEEGTFQYAVSAVNAVGEGLKTGALTFTAIASGTYQGRIITAYNEP